MEHPDPLNIQLNLTWAFSFTCVPYPRFLQISKIDVLCSLPSVWFSVHCHLGMIPFQIVYWLYPIYSFHRKPNHTHDCKTLERDHIGHHKVLPCCSSPARILCYLPKLLEWPVICYGPSQDIKNWKNMLLIIYWNYKFQPGLSERKQERRFSTDIWPFLSVNWSMENAILSPLLCGLPLLDWWTSPGPQGILKNKFFFNSLYLFDSLSYHQWMTSLFVYASHNIFFLLKWNTISIESFMYTSIFSTKQ